MAVWRPNALHGSVKRKAIALKLTQSDKIGENNPCVSVVKNVMLMKKVIQNIPAAPVRFFLILDKSWFTWNRSQTTGRTKKNYLPTIVKS